LACAGRELPDRGRSRSLSDQSDRLESRTLQAIFPMGLSPSQFVVAGQGTFTGISSFPAVCRGF